MTASSIATMFFMSIAPRPQTTPSTSSAPNGSRVQASASTGTTSMWERSTSGGSVAGPDAGRRAKHEPRPGVELDDLGRDPRALEHLGAVARGRRLPATRVTAGGDVGSAVGRVDGRDPDQPAEVLHAGVEVEERTKIRGHAVDGSGRGR